MLSCVLWTMVEPKSTSGVPPLKNQYFSEPYYMIKKDVVEKQGGVNAASSNNLSK